VSDLKTPPTEIEIASLLNDENMLPTGRDILRRLVYQRDSFDTLLDELWSMGKNLKTEKEERDLAQNMRNKIRAFSKS